MSYTESDAFRVDCARWLAGQLLAGMVLTDRGHSNGRHERPCRCGSGDSVAECDADTDECG